MAVGTAAVSMRFIKTWQVTQMRIKMIVKHARSKISHPINLCEEQVLSSIYGLFSLVKVIWIHSQSVSKSLNNNRRDNAMCSCHGAKMTLQLTKMGAQGGARPYISYICYVLPAVNASMGSVVIWMHGHFKRVLVNSWCSVDKQITFTKQITITSMALGSIAN